MSGEIIVLQDDTPWSSRRERLHWWLAVTKWRVLRRFGVRPPSGLVDHARRELELLGEDPDTTRGLLRVLRAFADMGHSGESAAVAIPMLERLLRFENLTPLTDDPAEWNLVDDGLWQSRRCSEAFSRDAGKTYYRLSEDFNRKPGEVRRTHATVPAGFGVA